MVLANDTTRSAFRNIKLIFQMVDRLAFGERGLELSLDKLFDDLLVEDRQATYCFLRIIHMYLRPSSVCQTLSWMLFERS